jgi:hypothetical protein
MTYLIGIIHSSACYQKPLFPNGTNKRANKSSPLPHLLHCSGPAAIAMMTAFCIGWEHQPRQGVCDEGPGGELVACLKGALLMSAAIVISAFVVGIILGSRFRVFVLVPAILFAIISTVAITFANGVGGGDIVLMTVAVTVSLQCGYVASLAAVYFAERSKLPGRAWRPSPFY